MHYSFSGLRSALIRQRLVQLRHQKNVQAGFAFALVFLGPVLVVCTYLALGPLNQGSGSQALRLILLCDLIYSLVIATLVAVRVARLWADRRSHSVGSRLHLRLSGGFAFVALVPTILVAIFAVLTVNIGIEGWFSERVRSVVSASLRAAQSYEQQSQSDLIEDATALANYLNTAKRRNIFLRDSQLRPLLTQGQALVQRGIKEAYLVDGGAELRTRGERSYLFDYEAPSLQDLEAARGGAPVTIPDWPNNELRALVHLEAFPDRYLYISRKVDGQLLALLDDTRQTVLLYNQLESERGKIVFNFALIYLCFAIVLILAAMWLGLWLAETLSRPVGRLAEAAQRVGGGDLEVQVQEEAGDDEIAMLGRLFNHMTRQLKAQRDALIDSHSLSEARRRLFDSVLSNITSGVIGLNSEGVIDFSNRSAKRLLDIKEDAWNDLVLAKTVPEFSALFDKLRASRQAALQEEIPLIRHGKQEILLVRMGERRNETGGLEGFVVAFDDVTDLVGAQRMAAWGDVARRIAHEIKNPLTPIALSAERIKRKFSKQVSEPADLARYTDVIVRQTSDLRKIVDEFSKFARMPEPELSDIDLRSILSDVLTLQENAQPAVRFHAALPQNPVMARVDPAMISQAFMNVIKNAGEAIETRSAQNPPEEYHPEITVSMTQNDHDVEIFITDNGVGLPPNRNRLFEPYVTTRENGTGLGLAIVKKIIEEHGGALLLRDAPKPPGTRAEIYLPLSLKETPLKPVNAAIDKQKRVRT